MVVSLVSCLGRRVFYADQGSDVSGAERGAQGCSRSLPWSVSGGDCGVHMWFLHDRAPFWWATLRIGE